MYHKIVGYPYISEAGFMSISDFVFPLEQLKSYLGYNPEKKLDINRVFDNCIIYVFGHGLKHFIYNIAPRLPKKFILITGVTDNLTPYFSDPPTDTHPGDYMLNNPNLIMWYGTNTTVKHPKLTGIPVGIPRSLPFPTSDSKDSDTYMGWYRDSHNRQIVVSRLLQLMRGKGIMEVMRSKKNSSNLVYINYTSCNSRMSVIEANKNFRDKLDTYLETTDLKNEKERREWVDNIEHIQRHKYCLEAPGVCLDGYRLWESLMVGTVPIVFSSAINYLYEDLPVLIIDSFEDLNRDYLLDMYNKIVDRDDYNLEKLFMDYWYDLIKDHK